MNKENSNVKKTEEIKPVESPKKVEQEVPFVKTGGGINLVPIMSEEEVVTVEKKKKLNISAIINIIIFLVITIVVVAFSTITKLQVEDEKKKLMTLEEEVKKYSSEILANQEIMGRIDLYKEISSNQYSTRNIFDYFSAIAIKNGNTNLSSFTFTSDTDVSFQGRTNTLDSLAKFWYLLENDEKVVKVSMDSMSRSGDSVKFEFKVTMPEEAFKSNEVESKQI